MPRLKRGVNSDYTIRTYNNRDAKVDVVARDTRKINTKAIEFDGDPSHEVVIADDDDSLSFTDGTNDQPLTISMWLKQTNTTGDQYPLAKGAGSAPLEYLVRVTASDVRLYLYTDTSNYVFHYTSNDCLSLNNWHHVVFTYDGNKTDPIIKIYVDGLLQSSTKSTVGTYAGMSNTNKDLCIGAGLTTGIASFVGQMADICIFRTELTSVEVTELYNGGNVIDLVHYSRWAETVSWWKMGDDLDALTFSPPGIKDYKGSNHGKASQTNPGLSIVSVDDVLGSDVVGGFEAPLPFVFGTVGRPSFRHGPQD